MSDLTKTIEKWYQMQASISFSDMLLLFFENDYLELDMCLSPEYVPFLVGHEMLPKH